MSTPMALPGINIRQPYAKLILSKKKIVETRTYKCPAAYMNRPVVVIETPGPKGDFKRRAVGIVMFTDSFEYKNKSEFYKDMKRHLVSTDSPFSWEAKGKWGWKVKVISKFKTPKEIRQRTGIVFTKQLRDFSL